VFAQRFLLLLVFLLMFLLPAAEQWFYDAHAGWYRPYLLWLTFIGISAWVQYSRDNNAI
jgi:hypothetical protein